LRNNGGLFDELNVLYQLEGLEENTIDHPATLFFTIAEREG